MKDKLIVAAVAVLLAVGSIGCVTTVDGQTRAGVPFTKDTIEGRYKYPVSQVFEAAKQVLQFNGTIYSENTINNSLRAKIDTRTVYVIVDEVEPGVARVRVQARTKGGVGDILLASELDKQIALHLPR